MVTGSQATFSFDNAFAKILEFVHHEDENKRINLTEEQIKQGAELLAQKSMVLKDLNGPLTSIYIRKHLPSDLGINDDAENQDENAAVPPLLFTPQTAASEKERLNTRKFTVLSGGDAKANNSRYNSFVITLGTPNLPRRHPGADDNYHPEKDIDAEALDLLERGKATLKYISVNDKKPCPRLLFLRSPVDRATEDPLTIKLHSGHTLADFAPQITSETQLPIHFHFAGHGNTEKVGPMMLENRQEPKALAIQFDQIVTLSGLKETLQAKKMPLVFHFDVCNAAFTDVPVGATADTIKTALKDESVMGKFAKQMMKLGYRNFVVHGYRGYYATLTSGTMISITNSLDPRRTTHTTTGLKALHTLTQKEDGFEVTLPNDLRNATFPVEMLAPVITATSSSSATPLRI